MSKTPATKPGKTADLQPWGALGEYMTDAMQRTVLFWDVMRQRSDQYYTEKAKEVPHVLQFDAELVLDARTFDKPVNYLLVRVNPPAGMTVDPRKRPFVVVDPRAGHGPGIGGFKADSELGVAMKAGHPAYLIGFTPEPMPGQTIEDIMHAEAVFLEKVIALHPARRRQALRHRQLPGRLGRAAGGGDPARAVRPDHRRRLAAVVLGRRRRREPDALHRRPGRRQLGDRARRRPRQRQVRRRHAGREFREPESVEHLVDQEVQPLVEGRYRRAALHRVREVVGRPRQPQRRGDPVDRRRALRRQPARHRRDRHPRRRAGRPAQHPLADHLLLLQGRQHHAAATGAGLDPSTSTAATTTSASAARRSSTPCTTPSATSASSSRAASPRRSTRNSPPTST